MQSTPGRESRNLPAYDHPPIVELVIGVQFTRLAAMKTGHFGAFWGTLPQEEEWSILEDAPALPAESLELPAMPPWTFRIAAGDVSTRLQIRKKSGNRMIQIQQDKLFLNWLGEDGGQYPRFDNLLPEFKNLLSRLQAFTDAHSLGAIDCNQWELTYVNHLRKPTHWKAYDDVNRFFAKPFLMQAPATMTQLEEFRLQQQYEIRPRLGRLFADIKTARRHKATEEVIVVSISSKGPVKENSELWDGLRAGHDATVTFFDSMISDHARQAFGRK